MLEPSQITAGILKWYAHFKRDLPWRKTRDPYKIWLSEIILQQTRVVQGLPYYLSFTSIFPDVHTLASAPEEVVLKAWEGLGYYSRARNLHRCAKIISSEYHGKFPDSYEKLLELPGIGPYTAAAIASFCFDIPVAVADGNVFRVLSRIFAIDKDIRKEQNYFRNIAAQLMPHDQPGTFNQAIMEFGALQCTPQSPDCPSCPVREFCSAFETGEQAKFPVKSSLKKPRNRYFHYLVVNDGNKLYFKSRQKGDIWQGLYDFPLIEKNEFLDEEEVLSIAESMLGTSNILEEVSPLYQHQLSHQKLHVRFYRIIPENPPVFGTEIRLADTKEQSALPKPVLISRYLNEHFF